MPAARAKAGRDRHFQAILPLRGKILNVEKTRMDQRAGQRRNQGHDHGLWRGLRPGFRSGKLRYHRIVCMTDADVDGSHIRILLLTFFYRLHAAPDRGWAMSTSPSRRCTR